MTIGELCDDGIVALQTGPFGTQLHAYDYVDHGVPIVPTEAIRNRRIDRSVLPLISAGKAEELVRHRLEIGDILFARRGVQATGHIGVVRRPEVGFICGTGAIRLRVAQDSNVVDPDFLSHVLANPSSVEWFKFHAIGATMPNLNEGIIRSFSFEVPSLPEQREIASILSTLEEKIELNRRMNETIECIARAIFKDWFVDFGPTRTKQMGGQPYIEPHIWRLFPDRLDEEAKPEGWSEKRVEDILELVYGKALKASDRVDGSIPVYGSGGITGYHNQAMVEGPSIIVGRKGTVGSLYWEDGPFFPIDTVFYVRPRVPLTFCYYHLQTLGLTEMNTDAAVPGLNRNNVYRLAVPWSPDELRARFDEAITPLRQRIRSNSIQVRTLTSTRDLLLPKLVSGEVQIRDAERALGPAT